MLYNASFELLPENTFMSAVNSSPTFGNRYFIPAVKPVALKVRLMGTSVDSFYIEDRPYSGRYCYGKSPMQTFIESLNLAKEKLLDQNPTAA